MEKELDDIMDLKEKEMLQAKIDKDKQAEITEHQQKLDTEMTELKRQHAEQYQADLESGEIDSTLTKVLC